MQQTYTTASRRAMCTLKPLARPRSPLAIHTQAQEAMDRDRCSEENKDIESGGKAAKSGIGPKQKPRSNASQRCDRLDSSDPGCDREVEA